MGWLCNMQIQLVFFCKQNTVMFFFPLRLLVFPSCTIKWWIIASYIDLQHYFYSKNSSSVFLTRSIPQIPVLSFNCSAEGSSWQRITRTVHTYTLFVQRLMKGPSQTLYPNCCSSYLCKPFIPEDASRPVCLPKDVKVLIGGISSMCVLRQQLEEGLTPQTHTAHEQFTKYLFCWHLFCCCCCKLDFFLWWPCSFGSFSLFSAASYTCLINQLFNIYSLFCFLFLFFSSCDWLMANIFTKTFTKTKHMNMKILLLNFHEMTICTTPAWMLCHPT